MRKTITRLLCAILFIAIALIPFTSCKKNNGAQISSEQTYLISTITSKVVKGFDYGFDDYDFNGELQIKNSEASIKAGNQTYSVSNLTASAKIKNSDYGDFDPEEMIEEISISGKLTGPSISNSSKSTTSDVKLTVKPTTNYYGYSDYSAILTVNGKEYRTDYDVDGNELLENIGIDIENLGYIDEDDILESLKASLTLNFDDLSFKASGYVDGKKTSVQMTLNGSITIKATGGKKTSLSVSSDIVSYLKLNYGSDYYDFSERIKNSVSVKDVETWAESVANKLYDINDYYSGINFGKTEELLKEFGLKITRETATVNGKKVDPATVGAILDSLVFFTINMLGDM